MGGVGVVRKSHAWRCGKEEWEVDKPWMLKMLPDSALYSVNSSLQCHCSIAFIFFFFLSHGIGRRIVALTLCRLPSLLNEIHCVKGPAERLLVRTLSFFFLVPCIS